MVFIQTTSVESIKNRSYLVWHNKQFEKDGEFRSQPIRVGNDIIEPATVVRDLGVLLDSELSLKKHISKIASVCYFHLRRLKPIRRILGRQITTSLVSFRPKSVGLLQLCVGWATEINHRSIAARSECCRETDLWSRSA